MHYDASYMNRMVESHIVEMVGFVATVVKMADYVQLESHILAYMTASPNCNTFRAFNVHVKFFNAKILTKIQTIL